MDMEKINELRKELKAMMDISSERATNKNNGAVIQTIFAHFNKLEEAVINLIDLVDPLKG